LKEKNQKDAIKCIGGESIMSDNNEFVREAKHSLTCGMEYLGTFDFEKGYVNAWENFYSDPLRDMMLQVHVAERNKNIQLQVRNSSKISHIQTIMADFVIDRILFKFEFHSEGTSTQWNIKESFLGEAEVVKSRGKWVIDSFDLKPKTGPIRKTNKVTLSMIVKDEADRYLEEVLREHLNYIDEAVIIDDGSTDRTVELCNDLLQGIPHRIIQNETSKFHNEVSLRKQQWEETIQTNPEWILNLDADEMFERRFRFGIRQLIEQDKFDIISFRLYDFWNEEAYREDHYWRAHLIYRPFLMRYNPTIDYVWDDRAQHSGRFPKNIFDLPSAASPLRLKHFGWKEEPERIKKYDRYMRLDPNGVFGIKEQYESILDKNPILIPWTE
jgi:hypothetical protein